MMRLTGSVALVVALAAAACGGAPSVPTRGVVEADIGGWHYRRYQSMLDVEVWVDGNAGEAHAATYVTADAERRGRIVDNDLVSAVVTQYAQPAGVLRELVRFARRLGGEGGYQVDEAMIGDVRVILVLGRGEAWALWAAGNAIVKVGGRGRDAVPHNVVEAYGARFPSQIAGGVMEGPLPPGPAAEGGGRDGKGDDDDDDGPAPYDPANPQPDYDAGSGA